MAILTSANNDNCVFYFKKLYFHTLWNLIALVRTFRKPTSSENIWQPCLFPDFHGDTYKHKAGNCYEIYIILHFKEVPLYLWFAVIFLVRNGFWILIKVLGASLGILIFFFPLSHLCIPKIRFKLRIWYSYGIMLGAFCSFFFLVFVWIMTLRLLWILFLWQCQILVSCLYYFGVSHP